MQVFKGFVLDAIHVVLTSGDWGPIPIFVDGQVVYLTKDNVDVLANIIDPICGPEQLARCQMRMTNSNGHTYPPHITALFVTLTNKGPISSHPRD